MLLKRKKKFFHFSNSVNLSVSYLLKGKGIPLGEIFLLGAQEEKAEQMSELSLPLALSTAAPNQTQASLEYLETSALRGPADSSSGPLPLCFLPGYARAGTVGSSATYRNFHVGNQPGYTSLLAANLYPLHTVATAQVSWCHWVQCPQPTSHLNPAPNPLSADTTRLLSGLCSFTLANPSAWSILLGFSVSQNLILLSRFSSKCS